MIDDATARAMYPTMYKDAPPAATTPATTPAVVTAPVDAAIEATEPARMTDPAEALKALYPTMTAAEPQESLGPVPEAVAELRKQENPLYDTTMMFDAAPWSRVTDDDIISTPAEKKGWKDEVSRIFKDVGFGVDDATHALTTGKYLIQNPPSEQQKVQMRSDSIRMLRERFGNSAMSALDGAKKLVARDPRVKAMLEKTGLGDDPKTVIRLAELARDQAHRGRLK